MRRSLYIETSVFSRLADPGDSFMRKATELFLQSARRTRILVFAPIVISEILQTQPDARRDAILRCMWISGAELLPFREGAERIAMELLHAGQWSRRRMADMHHVAYTILTDADALVTWDIHDLARPKTRTVVHAYARRLGLPVPLIGTPQEVAAWLDVRIV